jgi:nucleoside-diphosphate-sugar epimerase
MMQKKILVTGATGFIGKALITSLIDSDYLVTIVAKEALIKSDSYEIIRADFLGDLNYRELVRGFDCVIHLAAELWDPDIMSAVNALATDKLSSAAEIENIKLFIYASTVGVYGHPEVSRVTEETPTIDDKPGLNQFLSDDFLYDYSISKLSGERALQKNLKKTNGIILRFSNVISDDKFSEIIEWNFLKRLWRAHRRTHHIYITDAVASFNFFIERQKNFENSFSRVDIFNVTNDNRPDKNFKNLFKIYGVTNSKIMYKYQFSLPPILDFIKDRIKYKTLSNSLPAGLVDYSPYKLLNEGFNYKTGIHNAYREYFKK